MGSNPLSRPHRGHEPRDGSWVGHWSLTSQRFNLSPTFLRGVANRRRDARESTGRFARPPPYVGGYSLSAFQAAYEISRLVQNDDPVEALRQRADVVVDGQD